MKKEFVPYELALELREIGFDEPCLLVYDSKEKVLFHCLSNNVKNDILIDCNIGLNPKEDIKAPTFSQAFRWFREKYNVEHNNRPVKKFETDKSREISFYIDGYFISNLRFTTDKTYEEAELECLKKLIEIVKDGKK